MRRQRIVDAIDDVRDLCAEVHNDLLEAQEHPLLEVMEHLQQAVATLTNAVEDIHSLARDAEHYRPGYERQATALALLGKALWRHAGMMRDCARDIAKDYPGWARDWTETATGIDAALAKPSSHDVEGAP